MNSQHRPTYGGQAVIEGVMIRGQKFACIAARRSDGTIVLKADPLHRLFTGPMRRVPVLRGMLILAETLFLGMKALTWSANVSLDEDGDEFGKGGIILSMTFALFLAIGLFFLFPLFVSRPFEGLAGSDLISNVLEGVIRFLVFLTYIYLIGRMEQIRRVFMYHGAEHMTVHAQEQGVPLETLQIRQYPTSHPRCGTAFLLVLMVVAIAVFAFTGRDPLWWLIVSRIVLVPAIAAISYEVIRFSGFHSGNPLVRLITAPSLVLQKLTTRQPDDDQIEVAVNAMNYALLLDKEGDSALHSKPAQN